MPLRKPALALFVGLLSLAACAREPQSPSTGSGQPQESAAKSAAASSAPSLSATSAGALVDQAKTQQEGADTGTATDSGEAELERVAALPREGQLPAGKWVAGTNYKVLLPAQPTDVSAGKVEVIEMFWYGCPHCYALDPYLESWRKNKANYIEFVRVPVTWGEVHRAHARLYYTLQALGKLDALHSKVFEEIHQKNDELYVPGDEKATLHAQVEFAKANGVSEADFVKAYNSFAVQTALQHADDLVQRYKIDGVPTIVINGKYTSDVGMAGGQSNLIALINDLAASEKPR